jgi:hypothetical protein
MTAEGEKPIWASANKLRAWGLRDGRAAAWDEQPLPARWGNPTYDDAVKEAYEEHMKNGSNLGKKSFPVFEDEEHVYCFNCKLRITPPFQASGYADGHGAMRGQCTGQTGCKMITYFDWPKKAGLKHVRDMSEEGAFHRHPSELLKKKG